MPGALFHARYGEPIMVRFRNQLPNLNQGFGSPDVSVHLHNLHTPSESDGFPCDFFASGKLPDNKGDCGDPVAKTQALGASLHINATPTLVFADGTMIPGALPLPQLEKEMASAEAEAKKLAAAPK